MFDDDSSPSVPVSSEGAHTNDGGARDPGTEASTDAPAAPSPASADALGTGGDDVAADPEPIDAGPVDLAPADDPDLDAIERDLDAVDAALDRLADGTYWTDEVTGQPLPDDVLAADPTARRA